MIDELAVGYACAPVALAGIVASTLFALRDFADWWRERREFARTFEAAVVEDTLVEALVVVEKKIHYRHNIHCPKCGRFARRVEGWPDSVSECGLHGIQMRVTDVDTGPIPIIVQEVPAPVLVPIPEEIVAVEDALVTEPTAELEVLVVPAGLLFDPPTEPINLEDVLAHGRF